jgi:hypothetical protein
MAVNAEEVLKNYSDLFKFKFERLNSNSDSNFDDNTIHLFNDFYLTLIKSF